MELALLVGFPPVRSARRSRKYSIACAWTFSVTVTPSAVDPPRGVRRTRIGWSFTSRSERTYGRRWAGTRRYASCITNQRSWLGSSAKASAASRQSSRDVGRPLRRSIWSATSLTKSSSATGGPDGVAAVIRAVRPSVTVVPSATFRAIRFTDNAWRNPSRSIRPKSHRMEPSAYTSRFVTPK